MDEKRYMKFRRKVMARLSGVLIACLLLAVLAVRYSFREEPDGPRLMIGRDGGISVLRRKADLGTNELPGVTLLSVADLVDGLRKGPWYTYLESYRAAWLRLPQSISGRLPPPRAASEVLSSRSTSASWLGQMGPLAKAAVPDLLAIIEDRNEHWSLRVFAIQALGQIGPDASAAIPALRNSLRDEKANLRKVLRQPLVDIYFVDIQVRATAAKALAEIGIADPQSIELIRALLNASMDQTNEVARYSAAVALWRLQPQPDTFGLVSEFLSHSPPAFRAHTAYVLARMGHAAREFEPQLRKNAEDKDEPVRDAARLALREIGAEIPPLENLHDASR